jgi:hypothetical protein
MKGLIAALIAGAILYAVDSEYNDGRYSGVIKQAAISQMGFHIDAISPAGGIFLSSVGFGFNWLRVSSLCRGREHGY